MTYKIVSIPDAVVQPSTLAYHGIRYQAELYRPYIPKLPRNPFQKIVEYDQKKDKSCVVFSDMAMITHNCSLKFTNDEWREMWLEHQGERGGDIFKTSRELGQRFILNSFPIYLDTPEWEMYLDKWWAGQVEIWSDALFLKEWVHTGKITKLLPGATKNTFIHAMKMHKKDGRWFLQNSWHELVSLGYHNIYDITEVYHECIAKGILRPYWMAILPYYSHVTQEPTILKDHTRALKAVGLTAVSDVWDSFKKKVARVDGKVDKLP